MTPNKKPAGEMKEEANVSATENTQPKSAAAAVKRGPAVAKRSARKEAEELLDPEVKIESAIGKTEEWIIRNGKILLTALTVIVLVVAGILAYTSEAVPKKLPPRCSSPSNNS